MKKLRIIAFISLIVCLLTLVACNTDTDTLPTNPCVDGHTEVIDAGVAATCIQTGLSEGKHCSVCNMVLVAQVEIAAKGHTYGEWSTSVTATCKDKGEIIRTCLTCQFVEKCEIAATGHIEVTDTGSDATCTEAGLSNGKHCIVCQTILIPQTEIVAKGHNYGSWSETKAATCESNGEETRTCFACQFAEKREITATGHIEVTDTGSDATCTEAGLSNGKHCIVCQTILIPQTEIVAKGHNYGSWNETKAATCKDKGEEIRTCTTCQATEKREIEAKDHQYGSWTETKAATCEGKGEKIRTCATCQATEKREIEAKDHRYGSWTETKAATCEGKGEKIRTCATCQATEKQEIGAKGHSEVTVAGKAAKCTEDGVTEGKRCSVCNKVLVEQSPIPALGHNFVTGVCTRCGNHAFSTGFTFIPNGDGTCFISDIGTCTDLVLSIPATSPEGWKVVEIGYKAFSGCDNITEIIIPNTVEYIREEAFASCESLVRITIPNSVTHIGKNAFMYCSSLKSIALPEGITKIEDYLFFNCSALASVTIPNSVTNIGNSAFSWCGSLASITIPSKVDTIGSSAFSCCESLAYVVIPEGVTTISSGMFAYCKKLTSVSIPNSVTSIGGGAFQRCEKLSRITIPSGVRSIGKGAFSWCTALSSITLPDNVTSIEFEAFEYCTSLTSFTLPTGVTQIMDDVFRSSGLKHITIHNGVTSISGKAFDYIYNLEITFLGTKNHWKSIKFSWGRNTSYLVAQCTDGEARLTNQV